MLQRNKLHHTYRKLWRSCTCFSPQTFDLHFYALVISSPVDFGLFRRTKASEDETKGSRGTHPGECRQET
jgi:hypothetical protein